MARASRMSVLKRKRESEKAEKAARKREMRATERDIGEKKEPEDEAEGEKVIIKRRYSGFYQTDLELTLRNLEVTQIVIAGVFTHICPFTTAFDAFARDLCVYYPADATATMNRELHVAALKIVAGWCGYVVTTRNIVAELS